MKRNYVYIKQLTFTRFLAVITVVTYHFGYSYYPLNTYPWSNLFLLGPISVCYFFTLSGFIMSVVYYNPDSNSFDKYKYYKTRIARIFPVYFLALLLIFPKVYGTGNNDVAGLLLNILMLHAWVPPYPITYNFPGWSLSVEAFFYLVFPYSLLIMGRFRLKYVLLFAVIFWMFSQLLHIYVLNNYYSNFPSTAYDIIFYNPLTHLNTFIIGVAGGVIFLQQRHKMRCKASFNFIILLVSVLLIISILLFRHRFQELTGFRMVFENGLLAPLFIVFIIFLSLDETLFSRLFSKKYLVLLGDSSYSIYILHYPVYLLYDSQIRIHFNFANMQGFLVYTLLLIILSVLTYLIVECPARRFIRNYKINW
jgi:peptidoglycan/LPS O-acetylase OafA/YrhL